MLCLPVYCERSDLLKAVLHSYKVMAIIMSRNPLFWLLSLGFLVYTFLGLHTFSSGEDFSPGEGLVRMSFAVQAGIIIFLFLGVLFVRTEDAAQLDEVFETIPFASRSKLIGKLSFFITLDLLLSIIVWCMYYGLFSSRGIALSSFYIHAFYYILLFWSMTFFIALLVGMLLALWIKNKIIYPLIFFVWIIMGPVNTYFSGIYSPHSFISNALVWLNLGEPNPTSLFNDLYGFELSSYHWIKKVLIVSIVVLFLYSTFWFKKTSRNVQKSMIMVMTSLLLIISGLTLVLRLEHQTYNSNPNSAFSRDSLEYDYYRRLPNKAQPSEAKNYLRVQSYHVQLDIDRNVYVKTTLHVKPKSASDSIKLPFSLYHGFNVKTISVGKEKVDFTQQNDLVTLTLKKNLKPNQETTISFTYEGLSSPLFFANERAILLPYYFPWLPSVNTEPAFEVDQKYGLLRKSHQWDQPTDVYVTYSGRQHIFSNLTEKENGKWEGKQQKGVSIIAGELGKVSIPPYEIIEPTTWLINKRGASTYTRHLKDLFIFAKQSYGLTHVELPKQIFYIPTLSISDFSNEDLVWYTKDHLIYGTYLMHNESLNQNEQFLPYDLIPALTWKETSNDTRKNRAYLKFFSDMAAYLYNQKHEVEDKGELIDRSPLTSAKDTSIKMNIMQWMLSHGELNQKMDFSKQWYRLIQQKQTNWNELNRLFTSYVGK